MSSFTFFDACRDWTLAALRTWSTWFTVFSWVQRKLLAVRSVTPVPCRLPLGQDTRDSLPTRTDRTKALWFSGALHSVCVLQLCAFVVGSGTTILLRKTPCSVRSSEGVSGLSVHVSLSPSGSDLVVLLRQRVPLLVFALVFPGCNGAVEAAKVGWAAP